MSKTVQMTEGYWWSKYDQQYPYPLVYPYSWDKVGFLKALTVVESKARARHAKGWSSCRLCNLRDNGSVEYETAEWKWPIGYRHYVEKHDVRPCWAFETYIRERGQSRRK